ncbi:hypothetical protein WJX81_004028 [Elliptochloris bilobata]|uniref:THO complex subunit 1 n=1 Tax=Elliptochloris bilobata TaxID=381761 RepID=A0AAW1R175_9CHLO
MGADQASVFDQRAQSLQEAILEGVITDNASAVVATTRALSRAEVSAPWATIEEDGTPLLRGVPAEDKPLLEHSLRLALVHLAEAARTAQAPLMVYCHNGAAAASVPRLLDLVLWLSQHRQTDYPTAALALLEDAAELATTAEADAVFAYLEASTPWLKRAIGLHNAARYSTLRICNLLLRRLSKASAASLCGRILVFLATIMPLDERSGVNLTGVFNTAHSTPVEDVPEGTTDSNGQPVDAKLYRALWGLQDAFRHPYQTLDPARWASAVRDLNLVLDAFGRLPIAYGRGAGSSASELGITVKYLSSPRLMGLQLSDASLRRHFLVQALIFLQACRVPGRNRNSGLRPKQVDDVNSLEPLIYFELRRTPDCGDEFAAAVKAAMEYENHWVGWKNKSCPSFTRPPAALPARAARGTRAPLLDLGSKELNRLWNQSSDDVDNLRVPPRTPIQSLRDFLEPVITQMDPEEFVEEKHKSKHDPIYQWRAKRQIARVALPTFYQLQLTHKGQQAKDLDDVVHMLLPEAVPMESTPEPGAEGEDLQGAGQGPAARGSPAKRATRRAPAKRGRAAAGKASAEPAAAPPARKCTRAASAATPEASS